MSPDVARKLSMESGRVPYFWIDDVHVTGIIAERLGLKREDWQRELKIRRYDVEGWLAHPALTIPPLFGHPDSPVSMICALWNKTADYYAAKYNMRLSKDERLAKLIIDENVT